LALGEGRYVPGPRKDRTEHDELDSRCDPSSSDEGSINAADRAERATAHAAHAAHAEGISDHPQHVERSSEPELPLYELQDQRYSGEWRVIDQFSPILQPHSKRRRSSA
jgi:hypothetical protein